MKTIHIRDCPFCGSANVEIDENGAGDFCIVCQECQAVGPANDDLKDMIGLWNCRFDAAQVPE